MAKWECVECNWEGNEPITKDPYGDGGWQVCPKCDGTAALSFNNPENQRQFARALFATKGGRP